MLDGFLAPLLRFITFDMVYIRHEDGTEWVLFKWDTIAQMACHHPHLQGFTLYAPHTPSELYNTDDEIRYAILKDDVHEAFQKYGTTNLTVKYVSSNEWDWEDIE